MRVLIVSSSSKSDSFARGRSLRPPPILDLVRAAGLLKLVPESLDNPRDESCEGAANLRSLLEALLIVLVTNVYRQNCLRGELERYERSTAGVLE